MLAEITAPGRGTVGAAVEGGVGAQIAADLDAGVGARDVEEAGAVKRADPDVFDRLGLDRKVGACALLRAINPAAELRMSVRAVFILSRAPIPRFMQMHAGIPSAKPFVLNDNAVKPTHLDGGCDFFATQ